MSFLKEIKRTRYYFIWKRFFAAMKQPRVIIIGAGAAGIAAGSRLLENNINDIIILEARSRIGGRIHSVDVHGSVLDFGAQWCHGEDNNSVYALAKDLNVLSPSINSYDDYMLYSPTVALDKDVTDEMLKIAACIADDIEALQKSKENFGEYFVNRFKNAIKQEFGNNENELEISNAIIEWFQKLQICLNASPTWFDVSAKGLSRYQSCDGNYYLQWRNRGYKTILDILMREFPNTSKKLPLREKIYLNKSVTKIIWKQSEDVNVLCSDGSVYKGNHVLVTMPLGVLKQTYENLFDPELPLYKKDTIVGLGFGTINKIFLKFPSQWWYNDQKGISLAWTDKDSAYIFEKFPHGPNKDGNSWLRDVFGFYPIDNDSSTLLVWVVGIHTKEVEDLSNDTVIAGLMLVLNYFVGFKYDIPDPVSIVRSHWSSDPYSLGAYSYASMESEKMDVSAADLAQPICINDRPVLMFGGEATSSHHYSTVHGAISSGFREADRILNNCKFMATGESFASLSFAFRISPGYISRIVKLVLHLLRERLPPIFMPVPTKEDLLNRAAEFSRKWNFPNCIAAIDGKHVRIFCPGKSGSLFYNYKDFFSIVLLAFVDANYKFIMVDIGSYGKEGDSGRLAKSNLGQLINDTKFYPPPSTLPNSDIEVPFIIVGDEAFRLSKHVMKPFPRKIALLDVKKAVFNYRLSRARRVSENAFAPVSQVFRILLNKK